MSTRPAPQADTVEDAVRRTNFEFYQAYAALDARRMDAVWLQEDSVECLRPGGELFLGWEDVRTSWRQRFASTERIRIEISSVLVRVEGNVAWVSCREHIMASFEKDFSQANVQTTNIFLRREATAESGREVRWFLVAHHASLLPVDHTATVQ